jgi:hypothetical protein
MYTRRKNFYFGTYPQRQQEKSAAAAAAAAARARARRNEINIATR